jgi:hypothetical protein
MTGQRQHYGVESLYLLGHRVKTVALISATKYTFVDENYFVIFNFLSMYSICKQFYFTPICVTLMVFSQIKVFCHVIPWQGLS